MDIIIFGIWLVTYLVGAVRYILYLMHMFQQNSYKPREYVEWMGVHANVGRLLGKCLYALISLPLVVIGNRGCLIAACIMNGMTIWVNKARKAKKPLVYTEWRSGIDIAGRAQAVRLSNASQCRAGIAASVCPTAFFDFTGKLGEPSDREGD